MTNSDISQFTSPVSKLVRFFMRSRDRWKEKHARWKKKCKLFANQTRAVEKSRGRWRERALLAEKRLAELAQVSEELKGDLKPATPG